MKLHWGHGIAIFYTVFVLTLVVVVVKSTTFDNSLVTEEYYQRDINYQQEYDRRLNSDQLATKVSLEKVAGQYRVIFPEKMAQGATGTLHFYRPSSAKDDRTVAVSVDQAGGMNLSLAGLKPGRYRAILEWSSGGKDYLDEFYLMV